VSTNFKLYPSQKEALVTPANEILYGGALGGGKSYLARVASIIFSLEIPGLITYLFRRTFKEVLANHIYTPGGYLEMLKDMIEDGDVIFSKSDYSFTFYNGSRIQLAHSQYESDIYSHQGAQIGFLIVDEATHFAPTMIRFIRSRVRLGGMNVPEKWKGSFPRILYTANPGNVGHMYFKSNFVDHGSFKVFRAPEDEGSMRRIYIPAKLSDNKILLMNDPEYAQRVKGMGDSNLVKAMLEGDWESLSIGGFSDIWRSHLHVIDPFDIPHTWKIDRGYDYGYSAPAAALWFAESDGEEFLNAQGQACWVPKGTIFIINELYFANHKHEGIRLPASEQGKRIKQAEIEYGIHNRVKPGPADNSIFNKEEGPSTADQMATSGITFSRSNKSQGSRITGVELFRGRLQAVHTQPMEQPGVFVFRNCFHTIRTVPNLQNDEAKPEDISTTGEDHIWDVIRYRILAAITKAGTMKVKGV
jgi:hypothetical protein